MEITKQELYEMYTKGISVSVLAERIGKSESTVYRYLNDSQDKYRFPELKRELKKILLYGDLGNYLNQLSYTDICILRRAFNTFGYDRESKVKAIYKYLKSYSILGVYPENLTHSIVKKAYFRKARETHPDLKGDTKDFIDVKNAYSELIEKLSLYA